MHPKNYLNMLQDWIKAENDKKHSVAVKYIEKNVDLIDTDLKKFMDDCPSFCQLEVCEMLLKAGIDIKDYVDTTLKQYKNYIHDAGSKLLQYYTIDYKQTTDEYVKETLTWKTDWLHDAIVLDTIPALKEV